MKRTAKHFGAGLRTNFSWKKGDVVALFSPNCIDTPTVTFGTHWAGGIVSPANPAYTADELTIHLLGCGAKVLVTQAALLPLAISAANNVGMDRRNIILIGDAHDKEFRSFTSILDDKSRGERTKLDCKKDLGFLVYSSGRCSGRDLWAREDLSVPIGDTTNNVFQERRVTLKESC